MSFPSSLERKISTEYNSSMKAKEMKELKGEILVKKVIDLYPRFTAVDHRDSYHYSLDFFNERNILFASKEITRLLGPSPNIAAVNPTGKSIIVSNANILSVMDSIFNNNPRILDIDKLKMVVAYIVNYIKVEFETLENNKKLSIDVIQYAGDYGIRRVPMIKLNTKRPTAFIFNPKY